MTRKGFPNARRGRTDSARNSSRENRKIGGCPSGALHSWSSPPRTEGPHKAGGQPSGQKGFSSQSTASSQDVAAVHDNHLAFAALNQGRRKIGGTTVRNNSAQHRDRLIDNGRDPEVSLLPSSPGVSTEVAARSLYGDLWRANARPPSSDDARASSASDSEDWSRHASTLTRGTRR